jgi:hypothetical protein
MTNPVFILGTQRSGTTLLTRILSAHPSIFIQNELDLPKIFQRANNKNEVIKNIKKQLFIETGKTLDQHLEGKQEPLWGLKDPQLTEYIPQLREFIPDSKFIIIVRDGRGVTNSYMENKWGLGTNAYYGAQRWLREVKEQQAFMKESPENFYFVRYEDIIGDLETSLKNICQFLCKDFTEDLLNYDKKASDYKQQRENINTFKKPDKKLAEKWRNKLSSFEINVVEHVAGDLLTELGYKCIGKKIRLSSWQLMYFKWHQKIIGEIQIQYRWRKSAWKAHFEQKSRKKELT